MFTAREMLYTAGVPAAVALLVLIAAWRPWRREHPVMRGHWGAALAAGVAFLAGYALLDGEIPAWPPMQARHWLFYLAAGLTFLGLIDAAAHAFVHIPDWVRAEVALVVAGLVVLCLFFSLLQADAWPASTSALWMAGMIVALHVAWISTETLVSRLPRGAGPPVVFVFTSGTAVVLTLSGSLVYGRLAGVIAVVALAAFVVSLASPGFSLARGAVTVIVPITMALLFLGYHLADVDALNAVLLLGGLLLPWFARLPTLARRRPAVRATAAVVLALLPVLVATWRAREAFLRAQQQDNTTGELYTCIRKATIEVS